MRSLKEHPFDSEADKVRWDQTDRNFSRLSIIDIIVHFFWWVGRAMLGILILFYFFLNSGFFKKRKIHPISFPCLCPPQALSPGGIVPDPLPASVSVKTPSTWTPKKLQSLHFIFKELETALPLFLQGIDNSRCSFIYVKWIPERFKRAKWLEDFSSGEETEQRS